MENNTIENNLVKLTGMIAGKPVVSHEIEGEKFWEFPLEIKRLSGVSDFLPIIVPDKLLSGEDTKLEIGEGLSVEGELRSHNKLVGEKSKLIISTFAKEIRNADLTAENDENYICLNGFICKPPIYRTTPFNREICDAILAVNRKNFKSDYLPVISWGRNAKYLQNLPVGTKVNAEGRIQSRKYTKTIDGQTEERTAYEVSLQKLVNFDKINEPVLGL